MALHITPEELRALRLLATERPSPDIAVHLGTTERELDAQLGELFARLGVTTREEAVGAAFRRGLLVPGVLTFTFP